ncbi:MAG: peptidoglycan bridge formation glycyltransferase FemA/FemB family protein [Micrococcaceae bacterium]
MLDIVQLTADELEDLIDKYPEVALPVEQSSHWVTFDREFPYRHPIGFFAYQKNGKPVAVASLVYYSNKMRPSIVIQRGPVWLVEVTKELESELLDTLIKQGKKLDKPVLYVRLHLRFEHKKALNTFEPAFYNRAVVVDIDRDEKVLLKSFSSSARNLTRKARRMGVTVEQIPSDKASKYFSEYLMPIMKETTARNGFRNFDEYVYKNMLENMSDITRLFVANYEEKPVAWLISTEYRGEAIYYFAAGNQVGRKINANFLMQYECMIDAASRGNKTWNMTGVESPEFPELKNVTVFKRHFNKEDTIIPTMYDVPLNKVKYKAITTAINARRKKFYSEAH